MERKQNIALLALLCSVCFIAATFFVWRTVIASRPTISERWALYIENLKPESKIVVLSSLQRYAASKEFKAKLLAVVKISASIELSAWADVFYYIDAEDLDLWDIAWDKKSRILSISSPEPDCLPPAVRTETIEITSKGANLVTNTVFKLKKEAEILKDELSVDLLTKARQSLRDPELREKIKMGLAELGRKFCAGILGVEPERVIVALAGD